MAQIILKDKDAIDDLLTVLLNKYCYRYKNIIENFENKILKNNLIFQINIKTRFSKH